MPRLPILVSLLAAFALAGPLHAEPRVYHTSYNVSLIGLPVAKASFETTLDTRSYSVDGTLASSGLADIFSTIKGKSSVSGTIGPDRLTADRYSLAYRSDRKNWSSDVALKGGAVASRSVAPDRPAPKKDFVPVTPEQLKRVVDPLSGLMLRAGKDPASLCDRSLPFYDGWSRMDLKLSPAGRKPFSTNGFKGDAFVCDVRVDLVSGFRPSSKGVKFITRQTIQLWFAPIADTDIYAPVHAVIPTQIGPLTFTATQFAKG
ncbi:DUF3108 domain-containing protein [Mangrovibrevibacter kandeliae]|uniref:DUF3108 domain-containing protein n=1 Tax=Mangrovibrevibacter kandeliae TaxID=2968473 RepID=UPI002117ACDF|nr:DUF3108 domain-containing protein [Aurantimonas sp. CSK15Z-1]MCQ8783865.1 DUF3108 domain-containing protein [Aurantimonas sp. CSK15Z-1]